MREREKKGGGSFFFCFRFRCPTRCSLFVPSFPSPLISPPSTHYQRFLLPLELEMREAGTYTAGGAPVPDERPGSAGRTAAVSGVDPGVGDAV